MNRDPKDPRDFPKPQPMSGHFWGLMWMAIYSQEERIRGILKENELLRAKVDTLEKKIEYQQRKRR